MTTTKQKSQASSTVRAALYCRISDDRGARGLGVARQQEDGLRLAKRNGWAVAEVFVDNDISAFTKKRRPQYQAMLVAIERGDIDAVIAWHPDRLHRAPKELEHFIDVVEQYRVRVATVQAGEYDLTTPSGRATARIVGAIARMESEHKSERTKRQREQAAQAGEWQGGTRCFGYLDDGVTINPTEATLVREIADRVLTGELLPSIARDLTARGVATVRGAAWQTTTLRAMIINPRLAGRRVFRGKDVGEAQWSAILDYETHQRVRAMLRAEKQRKQGRPASRLLSSLLRCGLCGATLYVTRDRHGAPRYSCHSGAGIEACGRIAIKAEPIEALVSEMALLQVDEWKRSKQVAPKRRHTDRAAPNVEAIEADLDALAEEFGSGSISLRQWHAARAPLEARLGAAQAEADAHVVAHAGIDEIKQARSSWDDKDDDGRRRFITKVLDHVVIGPALKRGPGSVGDRITHVEWRDLA
jgi:DNA invertase Pin-like site-specific DNA recombinase